MIRLRGSLLDGHGRADQRRRCASGRRQRGGTGTVCPADPSRGLETYLTAAGCVLAATGLVWCALASTWRTSPWSSTTGIVVASLRTSLGPSVLASFPEHLDYDYFFVPPYYTFAVDDLKHLLSFGVMLWVGLVISTLVAHPARGGRGRDRARRTAGSMRWRPRPRRHAGARRDRQENLCPTDARALSARGGAPRARGGRTAETAESGGAWFVGDAKERSVAQWAFDLEQRAGRGTETLAGARALYLPMRGTKSVVGILAARPLSAEAPDAEALLPFAQLGALALERARLSEEARRAQLAAETEALRSSLLSSVSHDLRTPLTVISAAAGSLLDPEAALGDARRGAASPPTSASLAPLAT
ncbi:MAG: DUF4118 domain-containing protein [Candidatus Eisenbacteria bacterium]